MRDLELNPHEILQALEEHLRRAAPGHRPRAARGAGDEAGVQAGVPSGQPRRPSDDRILGSVLGHFRREPGDSCLHHPPSRRRAGGARVANRHADARQRTARGASAQALRAAAVPEELCHQPEPARAAGQDRAGLRTRPRDPAGARDPLPPRALELRDADRRAGRRQDRDRRRPRPPHRVRAGHRCRSACATARSSTCR